jgi:hypothetical protein
LEIRREKRKERKEIILFLFFKKYLTNRRLYDIIKVEPFFIYIIIVSHFIISYLWWFVKGFFKKN